MESSIKGLPLNWPAIEFETLSLESPSDYLPSNRLRRAAKEPVQVAIPAKIAKQALEISSSLATEIEDVSAAVTRFDQSQSSLKLPFAAVLLRTESASSSEVEQITASAKQLGLAALGKGKSKNADLVVDNVHSMEHAISQGTQVDIPTILAIHQILLGRSRPDIAGKIRQRQVWIGGSIPQLAQFVPPSHLRVAELLDDLTVFIKRNDLPVFSLIALAHAQFETIHPFEDGNGRTGRALVQIMLRNFGLTTQSTLPVSAGLLGDTRGYFKALDAYRAGEPEEIIRVFMRASLAAVTNGNQLSSDLLEIVAGWQETTNFRSDSTASRLIPFLYQSPVVNSKVVQEFLGVSEPSAIAALTGLEDAGILQRVQTQKRNRIWFSLQILEAYESFGMRARRG